MTEITLFRFENSELNAVMRLGEPWFFADDACAILDIKNSRDAISKLDDDEKGVVSTDTLGGQQNKAIISESGLYTLTLRCRDAMKPGTKPHRFRKWITSDVIPSIRKTGSYNAAPAIDLSDPAFLRQTLLGYTEKVIALEAEKAILAPKAEGFDRFANSTGRTILREVGKALHIGSKRGIELLREKKWTFRAPNGKWHAYSAKVDAGLLDVKYVTYTNSAGEEISTQQVYVTPKGMARLALEMGQN